MSRFSAVTLAVGLGFYCSWCSAAPTPSTITVDETTTNASNTAALGTEPRRCSNNGDCQTEDLVCDKNNGICVCKDSFKIVSKLTPGQCLPAKQLGEACSEDVQCRFLDQHVLCTEGFCVCDSGFYLSHEHSGSLCDPNGIGATPVSPAKAGTHLDGNMIAVIVVLAVMFLGICVALHLFSRARFRNRRTIFNSPHPRLMHIKLGKKKKKKNLTGSQHLPTPVHHPIVPRHHSFSGGHLSSPLPLNRVPKTRSHECLRSAARRESVSPRFDVRCSTKAPLAEKESSSVPSTEDLDKKTPEPLQQNGGVLVNGIDRDRPPGSPTVIITDADGSHHQVVSSSHTSLTNGSAVNV